MYRYVFISHADPDKAAIKPILEAMLSAGVPLWIDRPNEVGLAGLRGVGPGILSGKNWESEVREAYEDAACVLYFLSRNSNNYSRSPLLFQEIDHGNVHDKLIIAKLDDIAPDEINPFIRMKQLLDLSRPRDYRTTLEVLIEQLRRFIPQDSVLPRQAGQSSSKRFGRLQPYLCDRRTQRRRFLDAVEKELERDSLRPQMFFVVGEDSQCADTFVEQLFSIDLPDLLKRNNLSGVVENYLLRWPAEIDVAASSEEIKFRLDELQRELLEGLGLPSRVGTIGIERRLERQRGALFVYFDVNVHKWSTGYRRLLGEWINWWGLLNVAQRRYPVIIVGRYCYQSGEEVGILGLAS